MERDSFERFYYEKVALSEGCGCTEHIMARATSTPGGEMRQGAKVAAAFWNGSSLTFARVQRE